MESQFASDAAVLAPLSGNAYVSAAHLSGSPSLLAPPRNVDAQVDLQPRRRDERLNRLVNVVLAGAALAVLSPLLVLVALAVRFTSPGPVFYRQSRIGIDRRRSRPGSSDPMYDRRACDLGGRAFSILKFRSMTVDAEGRGGAVWAQKHDPRVTPVGGALRK